MMHGTYNVKLFKTVFKIIIYANLTPKKINANYRGVECNIIKRQMLRKPENRVKKFGLAFSHIFLYTKR